MMPLKNGISSAILIILKNSAIFPVKLLMAKPHTTNRY